MQLKSRHDYYNPKFLVAVSLIFSCLAGSTAFSQTVIYVSKKAYKERYLTSLNIGESSPLVGLQYGDPRAPISAPKLTVSGIADRHKYVCALIQDISGTYSASLTIANPRKGSTLTFVLPSAVIDELSPHAGELSVLVHTSNTARNCYESKELLVSSWGTEPYKKESILYALLNVSPTLSATASIKSSNTVESQFCQRLEHYMGDLRINPQRYGTICPLVSPGCDLLASLQIIVRSESHREAMVQENVHRECR